jgi:hypothetical protein
MAKPAKVKAAKPAKAAKTPGIIPDFPKIRAVRPLEKVVDKSNIPAGTLAQHLGTVDKPGYPLYQAYSAGVLLEQSFNLSQCVGALMGSHRERQIYIQHPSGRRELLPPQ